MFEIETTKDGYKDWVTKFAVSGDDSSFFCENSPLFCLSSQFGSMARYRYKDTTGPRARWRPTHSAICHASLFYPDKIYAYESGLFYSSEEYLESALAWYSFLFGDSSPWSSIMEHIEVHVDQFGFPRYWSVTNTAKVEARLIQQLNIFSRMPKETPNRVALWHALVTKSDVEPCAALIALSVYGVGYCPKTNTIRKSYTGGHTAILIGRQYDLRRMRESNPNITSPRSLFLGLNHSINSYDIFLADNSTKKEDQVSSSIPKTFFRAPGQVSGKAKAAESFEKLMKAFALHPGFTEVKVYDYDYFAECFKGHIG